MDLVAIKALIAQHVTSTIDNFEANWNTGSGQNRGADGDNSQGNHIGPPIVCTYKEFMKFKTKPFYENKGVIGLNR